jgi:hypothetical protein
VNDTFDRDRGGFAAADAERGDAALEVLRLERMQQRDNQPSAGGADRMAERAGAAIDVELFPGNAEIALRRHRHHSEGFVDLEQVDVTDVPADLVEQFSYRRDRRGGELLRFLAVGRMALDLGKYRQALPIGERSFGEDKGCRTVGVGR